MEYQIKKIEEGKYHVVRPDGTVKSTHTHEDQAKKSISYAQEHYKAKGRGKVN